MSIVALKRKSRRFLVPISANGFSLNGGYRNQRAIGDTNLSALTSGHNLLCNANDPAIVKRSTKNTKGYLYSTVNFPVCDNGNCSIGSQSNYVKDFSPENKSQSEHTVNKVKANAAYCVTKKINSGTNTIADCCKARSYHIGGKRFYTTYNAKNSGEYGQGAISAGEYLSAGLLKYNCLPTPKALAKPPVPLNSGNSHC